MIVFLCEKNSLSQMPNILNKKKESKGLLDMNILNENVFNYLRLIENSNNDVFTGYIIDEENNFDIKLKIFTEDVIVNVIKDFGCFFGLIIYSKIIMVFLKMKV